MVSDPGAINEKKLRYESRKMVLNQGQAVKIKLKNNRKILD